MKGRTRTWHTLNLPLFAEQNLTQLQPKPSVRDTSKADGHFYRGQKADESGNRREAIQAYQEAVTANPEMAEAHINLGTCYYNQHDYTAAEQCFRRAVKIDPEYTLGWFDLGNCLDEAGRLTEAIEAYSRAVKVSPRYADPHYNLALCYERLRNPGKSLKHWRAYLKLDSSGTWANHARSQISKIVSASGLKLAYKRNA